MQPPEDTSKMRLVPAEPAEQLAKRHGKEQLAMQRRREEDLDGSLAPFRVGSVPYLNAVPLTRGLERQIVFAPPSQLAVMLERGELDAALVSVTEVLLKDSYDVLDGIAIASLGEVKSVVLAHKGPLEEIREVYCDPASLTSVNLLRVLLAERKLRPEFKTLSAYDPAGLPDYAMLIGDQALDLLHARREHQIWDLGEAWYELTGLPFVYAIWALRRGMENQSLRRQLRDAKSFGLETLDAIVTSRTDYTADFRRDYLGWHIHYHLGSDEKRGLARFVDLLRHHGVGPVHEPVFVS